MKVIEKNHLHLNTILVKGISAAFIASALLFASCKTTDSGISKSEDLKPAEEQLIIAENAEAVSGFIASSDKYGNLLTDISEQNLADAGIIAGDIAVVDICGKTLSIPVVTNYSDVNVGSMLIRLSKGTVSLAVNHGNCAGTLGASEGTPISLILSKKSGYLSEFTIRHLEKSENRSDYASDEIFANARVVATKGMGAGKVYRSSNPSLTDARAPYANSFAKKSGIKTAINLANNEKVYAENQSKLQAEYYSSLAANGNVIFLDMGVTITEEDFSKKFAEGIRFLISKDGPYLIHCDEGKDRAGFVNAVLEAFMGASIEEITDDYMKSFENYYGVTKGSEKYDHISSNIVGMFESVSGTKVTNKNLKSVTQNYLINTLGLSKDELKQLKNKLK